MLVKNYQYSPKFAANNNANQRIINNDAQKVSFGAVNKQSSQGNEVSFGSNVITDNIKKLIDWLNKIKVMRSQSFKHDFGEIIDTVMLVDPNSDKKIKTYLTCKPDGAAKVYQLYDPKSNKSIASMRLLDYDSYFYLEKLPKTNRMETGMPYETLNDARDYLIKYAVTKTKTEKDKDKPRLIIDTNFPNETFPTHLYEELKFRATLGPDATLAVPAKYKGAVINLCNKEIANDNIAITEYVKDKLIGQLDGEPHSFNKLEMDILMRAKVLDELYLHDSSATKPFNKDVQISYYLTWPKRAPKTL